MNLLRSVFDPVEIEQSIKTLRQEQESSDFWQSKDRVLQVGRELKKQEDQLSKIKKFEKGFSELDALIAMIEISDAEEGKEFYAELSESLKGVSKELEKTRLDLLLSGRYDAHNAIISIHAGAGGTEAQDWASMLLRMYTMYSEKAGYNLSILNILDGDEAGIKSATILVEGQNAYGYLKSEKGVHRLVRISPFDSNSRRHTSFASVEVMPEITETSDIVISSDDLRVDTFRSSGAGGQHVNKTESAIRITHIPSGIVVACQQERSQMQNRETCMKMLLSKLVEKKEEEELKKLDKIRGELKAIEWGSQIRSYVFHPYSMVKDHRTNYETSDVYGVMDGNLEAFITEYLRKSIVK